MAGVKYAIRKVATPQEMKERWEKKKEQIEILSNNIDRLRRHISEDLKSKDEKKFLTALAIALIDKTGERVGNNDSADNGNFGITVLRKKHIKIKGDSVTLTYRGKSGVQHETSFSSSKLADGLKHAIKNSSGIRVFQTSDGFRIKNDGVNRYLADYDISAKDIRGFRSNDWIIKGLSKIDIPETPEKRKKVFLSVLKKVAAKIGHGKSTLRNHYMIPEIETSYINDGKIIDISDKEQYEKGGKVKVVSDGRKGGLLYGPTDKGNGKGIQAEVIGGRKVVLGGNEVIINEEAVRENCEELNRINTSTGGRKINCGVEGNMSKKMTFGGVVGSKNTPKEGLFIDNNNRQRFEIDDSTAIIDYKLLLDFAIESDVDTLIIEIKCESILKKWEGYKHYPDISKIYFIFEPFHLNRPFLFAYDEDTDIILINSKRLNHVYSKTTSENPDRKGTERKNIKISNELRRSIGGTIIHELQHAIQKREKIKIDYANDISLMSDLKKKYGQESMDNKDFEVWIEKTTGKPYWDVMKEYYENIPSEKEALEVERRAYMSKGERDRKIPNIAIKMDGGGNIENSPDYNKIAISSSRFKPSETIVFNPPLIGENGNKLVSYTWAYEMTMQPNREGELTGKRISDWTQAENSADTGRDIVHKYTIEFPNGTLKTVSSESVPVLLGLIERSDIKVFGNLATASKTLAKQQMKIAILEAQENEYNSIKRDVEKLKKPDIELAKIEDLPYVTQQLAKRNNDFLSNTIYFKMDGVIYAQPGKNNIPDRNTKEQLDWAWERSEIEKRGGKYPSGIYDLRQRVERQKKRMENLLSKDKKDMGGRIDEGINKNTNITNMKSERFSFKNDFGSFTSVFVYVPVGDAKEFLVQTTVRKMNIDKTISIQKKEKWFPVSVYDNFIGDLRERMELRGKMEGGGRINTLKDLSKEIKEENFILPEGHRPFIKVSKGGSSCSTCRFMAEKDKGYICTNKYYQKWEGTDKLPKDIENYCSDWYEPKQGSL